MPVVKNEYEYESGNFVICDVQGEYSENLLGVLRKKYPGDCQFHIFSDIGKMKEYVEENGADILLIGEEYDREERKAVCAGRKYLLTGSRDTQGLSDEIPLYRYQSVEGMIRFIHIAPIRRKKKPRIRNEPGMDGIIGIYSPVHRIGKTKFALQLGQKMAEKKQVLYLNLEGYSGDDFYFSGQEGQDLGTLLYYVRQEMEDPGLRISSMTCQMGNMDYIMPMENEFDLRQVKGEEWLELLDIISRECIYDTIILDLGDCVDGLYDILRKCVRIYTHYIEEGAAEAKIRQYERNLKAAGYGDIIAKTMKKRTGRSRNSSGKRTESV